MVGFLFHVRLLDFQTASRSAMLLNGNCTLYVILFCKFILLRQRKVLRGLGPRSSGFEEQGLLYKYNAFKHEAFKAVLIAQCISMIKHHYPNSA